MAHAPLHGSGRAELPHPAPTLGKSAQAHERIRMTKASRRKPFRDIAPPAAPWQVVPLARTTQNRPPQIARCLTKPAQHGSVHGHTVIPEMSRQERAQRSSLFPHGRVQASPQFCFQSPQLSLPASWRIVCRSTMKCLTPMMDEGGKSDSFAGPGKAGVAFRPSPPRRYPGVSVARAEGHAFHGSITDLYVPLPTLPRRPRGQPRMTRGGFGAVMVRKTFNL